MVQGVRAGFVPIGQRDVLTAGHASKCLFKPEQIHAVPGGEQHVAVVAVTTPILRVSFARAANG